MKRVLTCVLCFSLLTFVFAVAEEDDDEELSILEVVEEINLDAITYGDVEWTFPIPLEEINPAYVVLANKHYLLPESFVPDNLVRVNRNPKKGGIYCTGEGQDGKLKGHHLQEVCAEALYAMNADMQAIEGFQAMYLKSAYRSYGKQRTMYKNRLARNNGKDDGWVSMPGASDHQTGLGCDVIPYNWTRKSGMNDKMILEEECQWMAEHCHEYGFVIRYPQDKQEITEINTEPWHLRYVGIAVATYMYENELCLEEFTEELQAAVQEFLERGGNPEIVKDYIQVSSDS